MLSAPSRSPDEMPPHGKQRSPAIELSGRRLYYDLHSIIYLGGHHFTARVRDSSNRWWNYDGMWDYGTPRLKPQRISSTMVATVQFYLFIVAATTNVRGSFFPAAFPPCYTPVPIPSQAFPYISSPFHTIFVVTVVSHSLVF